MTMPLLDLPPTFWGLMSKVADAAPDRPVVEDDYGRVLTAGGLRDQAERAAAGFAAVGVGAGDVVSWQLPTRLEAVVTLVALARLGAVQNPVIPILRHREVAAITAQVRPRLIVVPERWRGFDHGALAKEVAPSGTEVLTLDLETSPGGGMALPLGDPASLPAPPSGGDECRWLYFSSGTTADPKGARHTDTTIMAAANGMVSLLGLGAGDVYPIAWPFSHIGGATMLTAALAGGALLALFDAFDPMTTPERMAAHHPTILGSAVPFFRAYLDAQIRHGDTPLYPDLRACTGGGAPIPGEISRELHDAFGVAGVVVSWGLTEFPIATCATPDDPPDVLATTVGGASPGVDIKAVTIAGSPAEPGEEGELRLRGPQQFLGYIDSSLDAAAFDEQGWFRTGDLGVIEPSGAVRITGRLKDVIIRNAENISALEVEDVVLRHPDVLDVAVVGLPDVRTGERVCAVVVPMAGRSVTVESLAEHCLNAGLARQKCPEQVEVVEVIERNPMGKALKAVLVARLVAAQGS
jgi:cyclohexanecarboxylate-CoA ligase